MREFYSYVWRSSAPRQIVLRILAISAALLAMAPLELQRHIINTLAGHEHFGPPALPSEVTRAGGRNEVCTTLRWREPDSNHRSRSCHSETAARKVEPLTRFRPETAMLAWSGSP